MATGHRGFWPSPNVPNPAPCPGHPYRLTEARRDLDDPVLMAKALFCAASASAPEPVPRRRGATATVADAKGRPPLTDTRLGISQWVRSADEERQPARANFTSVRRRAVEQGDETPPQSCGLIGLCLSQLRIEGGASNDVSLVGEQVLEADVNIANGGVDHLARRSDQRVGRVGRNVFRFGEARRDLGQFVARGLTGGRDLPGGRRGSAPPARRWGAVVAAEWLLGQDGVEKYGQVLAFGAERHHCDVFVGLVLGFCCRDFAAAHESVVRIFASRVAAQPVAQ